MKKAVYAGSFDPVTNGHLWMIDEGLKLFDELVVAIGVNPDKRCMFSVAERLALLVKSSDRGQVKEKLSFDTFENLYLIDYAKQIGATHVLRGIRGSADVPFEKMMRHVNGDLFSEITTVFLMPPRELAEVSSSLVKGLVGPVGWETMVAKYVPPPVLRALKGE